MKPTSRLVTAIHLIALIILALLLIKPILIKDAAAAEVQTPKILVVGTSTAPPFSYQNKQGKWRGSAIDLWQSVARRLQLRYRIEAHPVQTLIKQLQSGKIDLIVTDLSVTAAREQLFDFTHPYAVSGIGIATPTSSSPGLSQFASLFTAEFLKFIGALIVAALVFGLLIWLVERHKNPEQFHRSTVKGVGAGIWFAIVTMTTVGYGDKSPLTPLGRLLSVVWMFVGIIFIAFFTAYATSALTVQTLNHKVNRPEDLAHVRVMTVSGTTSQDYLDEQGLTYTTVANIDEAIKALAAKKVDAVVYDIPVMRYLINQQHAKTLAVLPNVLQREDYAFALRVNAKFREKLNYQIIQAINSGKWKAILGRYTQTNQN